MKDLLCHILIERADDIPGFWVGHCLELDVVSQGTSIGDTIEMTIEASMLHLYEDGLWTEEELQNRRAPEEFWEAYMRIEKLLASGNRSDDFFCATTTLRLAETTEEQEQLRLELDKLLQESAENRNEEEV